MITHDFMCYNKFIQIYQHYSGGTKYTGKKNGLKTIILIYREKFLIGKVEKNLIDLITILQLTYISNYIRKCKKKSINEYFNFKNKTIRTIHLLINKTLFNSNYYYCFTTSHVKRPTC